MFNFIELLNSFIEEQGVTTSALGKLPTGVKAWHAIESLKQSEFANLYISLEQIKSTIKTVSEKMLDIASNFVSPQPVTRMEGDNPDYFDIVGQRGVETKASLNESYGDEIVPIKNDYEVEIDIQSGLGFTDEGKKGRMMEIMDYMVQLSQAGLIDPMVLRESVKKMLEIYQFGPTEEMMEALDRQPQMDEQMLQQIKVAVAETLKDVGFQPPPSQDERIMETKVGVAEAAKDLGGKNATT